MLGATGPAVYNAEDDQWTSPWPGGSGISLESGHAFVLSI